MNTPKTLTQFLINNLVDHPEQKDLTLIMSDLASIGKYISYQTNKAGILDIFGLAGHSNNSGDDVKKMDVIANDICINFLRQTNHFAALASEEEESIVEMGSFGKESKYIIAFDPIDGSSNIDVNIPVGTIFSIHNVRQDIPRDSEEQFNQPGKDQVTAGYILYGTSTVMVFTFGDEVHEFTLDQGIGEFMLSRENIKTPHVGKTYTINESNIKYMQDSDAKFCEELRNDESLGARQVGSLVADFHRNLLKGGNYFYPLTDKKESGKFEGRLRVNHELKALAYIIEHAGGKASTGQQDILELIPSKLHERCAIIIGSPDIVDKYIEHKNK